MRTSTNLTQAVHELPPSISAFLICRFITQEEYNNMMQASSDLAPINFLTDVWRLRTYAKDDLASIVIPYRSVKQEGEDKISINFPTAHMGQCKLLMNEVEFLCFAQRTIAYDCLTEYTVLYVGAADGHHSVLLSQWFPEARFELWDPRSYHPALVEYAEKNPKRMTLHTGYFTDEDAAKYVNSFILFMCDIRTTPERQGKEETETVDGARARLKNTDHEMQKKWIEIIKPHMSMLKFSPMYGEGVFEYFSGPIRTQPFMPMSSTESRLIVFDGAPLTTYDTGEFEKIAQYHNAITRLATIEPRQAFSIGSPDKPILFGKKRFYFPAANIARHADWRCFIPTVLRCDDWRCIDILRTYVLTRLAMNRMADLPTPPPPLELHEDSFYAFHDIYDGVAFEEINEKALALLEFVQRFLGTQDKNYISKLHVRGFDE